MSFISPLNADNNMRLFINDLRLMHTTNQRRLKKNIYGSCPEFCYFVMAPTYSASAQYYLVKCGKSTDIDVRDFYTLLVTS